MNKITRRSFYSFLTLYLLSSFIFLSLASYWFYSAQVSMEMSANYHKMSDFANQVSSDVIYAQMMNEEFKLKSFPNTTIALFNKDKELKFGSTLQKIDFEKQYYMRGETFTFVSQNTNAHLGIEYVVVQNNECTNNITKLKNKILYIAIFVGIIIIIIAILLSYIFLKPIKDKMQEIENFVRDTTHELNTPITALMMSTSRAKSKHIYDEKIMQNISISTKQLYEIYSSLSFLSFDHASETAEEISFDLVLSNSIEYFSELLQKKDIKIHLESESCILNIAPTKAKMLVSNLISNAIKYSHPHSSIKISLKQDSLTVQDEGIGIDKEKLALIFKRFTRANSYAGGFGVGLNIVESIAKEYDYTISVDSELNIGTKVSIRF